MVIIIITFEVEDFTKTLEKKYQKNGIVEERKTKRKVSQDLSILMSHAVLWTILLPLPMVCVTHDQFLFIS